MKRQIISVFLLLFTVLSFILLPLTLSIKASALEPYNALSSAYKTSKYYDNLRDLELVGDERSDIVRVALTQLGYHEGNSNSDFHGGNSSGSRNFVEYNRIYGRLDNGEGNGVSYGYHWCAAFVAWCARQAGISTVDIPTDVSCIRFLDHFKKQGTYKSRTSGYEPKSGDVILFRTSGATAASTHTGIVRYSADGYVHTIEGNTSDNAVALRSYKLTDSYIVGYGAPKLDENSNEKVNFAAGKNYRGDYVVTATSLNVRNSPSTSATAVGRLIRGDVIKVLEISGDWGMVNDGGVSGWINLKYMHILTTDKYTVNYNTNGGGAINVFSSQRYGEKFTVTDRIPIRRGYSFLGWSEDPEASDPSYTSGKSYTSNGDRVLYAVWKFEGFKITFLNYDGSVISSERYAPGESVTPPPQIPVRASDGVNNYIFVGWDSTIEKVNDDKTYTAVYKTVPIATEGGEDTPDPEQNGNVTTSPEGDNNASGGSGNHENSGSVDIVSPGTNEHENNKNDQTTADDAEDVIELWQIVVMLLAIGLLIALCAVLVVVRSRVWRSK